MRLRQGAAFKASSREMLIHEETDSLHSGQARDIARTQSFYSTDTA